MPDPRYPYNISLSEAEHQTLLALAKLDGIAQPGRVLRAKIRALLIDDAKMLEERKLARPTPLERPASPS